MSNERILERFGLIEAHLLLVVGLGECSKRNECIVEDCTREFAGMCLHRFLRLDLCVCYVCCEECFS